jgi:hypothetical protein
MDDISEVTVKEETGKMPGGFEEEEEVREMVMIQRQVPKMDREEFIAEWRTHPLVPTLMADDARRPKAGRIDLWAACREREVGAERDEVRSEWTVLTEVEEERHGEYMKLRPGEDMQMTWRMCADEHWQMKTLEETLEGSSRWNGVHSTEDI